MLCEVITRMTTINKNEHQPKGDGDGDGGGVVNVLPSAVVEEENASNKQCNQQLVDEQAQQHNHAYNIRNNFEQGDDEAKTAAAATTTTTTAETMNASHDMNHTHISSINSNNNNRNETNDENQHHLDGAPVIINNNENMENPKEDQNDDEEEEEEEIIFMMNRDDANDDNRKNEVERIKKTNNNSLHVKKSTREREQEDNDQNNHETNPMIPFQRGQLDNFHWKEQLPPEQVARFHNNNNDENKNYDNDCDDDDQDDAWTEFVPTSTTRMHHHHYAMAVIRTFYLVLVAGASVGAALVVLFYTRQVETNDFQQNFQSDAEQILWSIRETFDTTLAAADNLVTMIVAQKVAMNTTFPFVAVSNYALQAAKVKSTSKAFVMGVHYRISEENRAAWEEFAAQNNEFVREAWALQAQDETFRGSLDTFPNIEREIFANFPTRAVRPPDSGPYLVSWQNYPIIYEPTSAPYNYDLFAVPFLAKRWLPVLETKRPHISGIGQVLDPNIPYIDSDQAVSVNFIKNFIPPMENPAEPTIILVYPIIDQQEQLTVSDLSQISDDQLVGTHSFTLFYRDILRNILPDRSRGIMVVTETACGQVFTYQINGAQAVYVSNTDLHNTDYDDLQITVTLTSLLDTSDSTGTKRSYTGIPLSDATCPITIRISPSRENEDMYRSNNPTILSLAAGLSVVFVGGLFLLYEWFMRCLSD